MRLTRHYATEHYVDALLAERRAQTDASQRAGERAIDAAERASDAVTRHQNEFREALADAQERYVDKANYDTRHAELERRLDLGDADRAALRERLANLFGRGAVITGVIAICTSAIVGFIVHLVG